jgi:hypothetical protein
MAQLLLNIIKLKIPVFSLIIICLFSCKGKNNNYVYYDMYLNGDRLPSGAYRFSNNGACVYYIYDNSTGKRYIWDVDDLIEKNSWEYLGNGIIDLCGYKYNFLGLSKDTIYIQCVKGNVLERIIKSKNQDDSKIRITG